MITIVLAWTYSLFPPLSLNILLSLYIDAHATPRSLCSLYPVKMGNTDIEAVLKSLTLEEKASLAEL